MEKLKKCLCSDLFLQQQQHDHVKEWNPNNPRWRGTDFVLNLGIPTGSLNHNPHQIIQVKFVAQVIFNFKI